MIKIKNNGELQAVEKKLKYWSEQLHDMSERNRLLHYRPTRSSSAAIESPGFFELFETLVVKGKELMVPLSAASDEANDQEEHRVELESNLDEFGIDNAVQDELAGGNPAGEFLESLEIYEGELEQEILEGELIEPEDEIEIATPPLPKSKPGRKGQTHGVKASRNEIQTNHTPARLNTVMYNLRYMARTVQEEQGINILYVTFGMLKWKEHRNNTYSLAPLLMVPVHIRRENPNSPFRIMMAEEDIVLNPVLQIKLASEFGIHLPEITNEINGEQLDGFMRDVRERIEKFDGWLVEPKATLGVFNFLTLLLIRDFELYKSAYSRHPLVQVLSGVGVPSLAGVEHVPQAKELDDLVDPAQVYQVLDADSSQQEAIEAAKRGVSFILQGPPGTGKSQTIANIIVESMMAGKKVLFVSQKMAALEVVKNRLEAKGLGEFCLEIHSHKMDKRKVIRDLMNSLTETQIKLAHPDHHLQQKELKRIRDELNSYVRQLHEPRLAMGLSLYQAQGAMAQLEEAPALEFSIPGLEKLTSTGVSEMISLVREISGYTDILAGKEKHIWNGFNGQSNSLEDREQIAARMKATAEAMEEFHQELLNLSSTFRLPPPETIQEHLDYYFVYSVFQPGIFSTALRTTLDRYLKASTSMRRYIDDSYREDAATLRSMYRSGVLPSREEILRALEIVKIIHAKRQVLVSDRLIDFTQELNDLSSMRSLKQQMTEGYDFAKSLFDPANLPSVLENSFKEILPSAAGWFREAAEKSSELEEWANFNSVRQECIEIGLQEFITKAEQKVVPPKDWPDAFARRLYTLLADRLIADRPALGKFKGTTQTELVRRFKALDLVMIDNNSREIKTKLYKNKPQQPWMEAGSAETAILRRESNKKRRLKPLRKLFMEIPNLIQALKPCLMMSPLTVCQLLDPGVYEFDLAVFDEASQIPPEYAISAILRARQVVVSGDAQQLPPMNFFHAIEADNPQADLEEAEYESILSACDSSGFPNKMLNWHYRSRDESLIAYSNYHFYENRLFTFPSSNLNSPTTGLKFIFVEHGIYQPGEGARYNLPEARKVAELVYEHLIKNPELSLGVVAFSVPQRQAIEMEVEKLLRSHPDLNSQFTYEREEPIFIKNLENVQGDERDVIILSVGYGRDATGRMALNFGPINRDGGTRRLNVAVTRARYLLKLVSSIQPEEIDLNRASSRGAALLRNYLEAARDGIKAVYRHETKRAQAEFDSLFEESVYHVLTQHGLQIVPRVGVSQYRIDLAVIDPDEPGRYLLGIECDGPMYLSGMTARDRDRLRQQVLEGLGWRIHRIWSRDWIQKREQEIARVLEAVEESRRIQDPSRLLTGKKLLAEPKPQSMRKLILNTNPEDAPSAGPLNATPFQRATLQRPEISGRQAFLDAPLSQIIDGFQLIANQEGPVSLRMAKSRLLESWETRRGKNIDDRLEKALQNGQDQKAFRLNGNFLWPLANRIAPLRIHNGGRRSRTIEDIAPEEIESAVRECIKSALTIESQDLIRETLKLFGFKVMESSVTRIEKIINELMKAGVIAEEKGKLRKGRNF